VASTAAGKPPNLACRANLHEAEARVQGRDSVARGAIAVASVLIGGDAKARRRPFRTPDALGPA